jgi:hypothetical protein
MAEVLVLVFRDARTALAQPALETRLRPDGLRRGEFQVPNPKETSKIKLQKEESDAQKRIPPKTIHDSRFTI